MGNDSTASRNVVRGSMRPPSGSSGNSWEYQSRMPDSRPSTPFQSNGSAGVSVDDAAAVSGSSAMSAACSVRSAMAMTSSAVIWWFPSFVTMVTGSTSSSLSMFSRRRSRSCPAARSGRPPLVPPASRMSETCRAASSDSSSTVPSGMPCPPASDVKTICGPWPVSCPGFVPAVPEVSAAVVSGVSVAVLKESHESGLSKMPSRRLLSSVSVASGPSWTMPSSSNQSSR